MIRYSRNCVRTIMNLVLAVPKWMICLYHTNLSQEVPLSFVWLKFSSFGWDVDMRRIRSDKTLSLGMPKESQGNIEGRSKQLSLGMPQKASPLSSPTLSVTLVTWSYTFIHHMIWVLLGASFSFVRICLLLFRIIFCIFLFNKKSSIAFAMLILQVYELLFQNRKFVVVAKIPEKSQNVIEWWNFFHSKI